MISGSSALTFYGVDVGESKDMDIICTKEMEQYYTDCDVIVVPQEVYDLVYNPVGVITPDMILTLKMSHLSWNIKWDKTKRHIITLLNLGCKPNMEAYEVLKKYWESVHGDKSFLSLNKSKEQFFDDNVVYKYDHDYLHSLVAYPNDPVYTKCLKDNEDVLIDYNKFIELSYEEQLQMFREEVTVIAIERWLVNEANKGLYSWYEAYKLALKKTITNLTKNWANTFVIMNIRELSTPKWDLFNNALNVLGENMSKVDMKVFEDILEEYVEKYYDTDLEYLLYGLCENDIETDSLSTVKSYTHLQYKGGGEGGGEYCYSVFELNGVIYKAEYSYYSHYGHDYCDIVSTLRVVTPVQKTITVYE